MFLEPVESILKGVRIVQIVCGIVEQNESLARVLPLHGGPWRRDQSTAQNLQTAAEAGLHGHEECS
jgi:hypothetical protein